ncbi:MOSC domain-containing protein [Angustibacter peucedani]
MDVGRVLRVTRHPLKSVGGEPVGAAVVTPRGLEHDRRWAVYLPDGGIGSGKATTRFRRVDGLLDLSSRVDGGRLVVRLPDGEELAGDDPGLDERLSQQLGRPVRVREESDVPHHDECPVHLVTTSTLRAWGELAGADVDPRRARANLLVDVDPALDDGFVEDAWRGRRLRVGEVELAIGGGMPRCVMVSADQRGLPADNRLLKSLGPRDVELGVMSDVVTPGTVRVGDVVTLL